MYTATSTDFFRMFCKWPVDAPGSTLSAALAAFIALLFRPAMRRRLQTIHSRIGRIKTDSFTYTLETFFYTAVFALPFPLLIRTAALALRSTVTDTSILIQACADGLIDTLGCHCPFFAASSNHTPKRPR